MTRGPFGDVVDGDGEEHEKVAVVVAAVVGDGHDRQQEIPLAMVLSRVYVADLVCWRAALSTFGAVGQLASDLSD